MILHLRPLLPSSENKKEKEEGYLLCSTEEPEWLGLFLASARIEGRAAPGSAGIAEAAQDYGIGTGEADDGQQGQPGEYRVLRK